MRLRAGLAAALLVAVSELRSSGLQFRASTGNPLRISRPRSRYGAPWYSGYDYDLPWYGPSTVAPDEQLTYPAPVVQSPPAPDAKVSSWRSRNSAPAPTPAWALGSRRLGADKDGDYVWVGNSFGGTLGRIDIRTKEIKLVPLPNPEAHQPDQVQVDSKHNVWTNL